MRLLYKKLGFPGMQVLFLVGKIPWRRDRLLTPVFLGLPGGSDGKDSAFNVGDLDSIPGLGPLEEGITTSPVFLPGESPRTEEPGRLQSIGSQRFRHDGAVKHSTYEKLLST